MTEPSLRKDGPSEARRPTAAIATARPFRRILVANRGEIALRIIRTCREMGIETVAVYSDADRQAAHVRAADGAVRLGPPSPSESYLAGDRILAAAHETAAEAIHPGYGFLSERASFAAAVEADGLTWIGPSSAVIAALGDKLAARRVARRVGVPVVPGTLEPADISAPGSLAKVVEVAEEIGYPLLVKAAAGGGGRGMRQVDQRDDLPEALEAAVHEAEAAFGAGAVYLERVIGRARHIEVQLLGDHAGRIVALGERDCSIQRRHQKLVEEAPAAGLSVAERKQVQRLAVDVAAGVGLTNAATAEFLYDDDGSFWFLEVNPRLQVEHGVTELVSGLDLVREQIWLAAGAQLSAAALAVADRAATPARHAIEVRISLEDPGRAFAPLAGTLGRVRLAAGPGVRVDTAVETGEQVPPDYDPLIAKLIVEAADRPQAIERLRRALDETEIDGVQTTLPFHRFLVANEAFRAGNLSTRFVEEEWDGPGERDAAVRRALVAAGLAAIDPWPVDDPTPARPRQEPSMSGWSKAARVEAVDRGLR